MLQLRGYITGSGPVYRMERFDFGLDREDARARIEVRLSETGSAPLTVNEGPYRFFYKYKYEWLLYRLQLPVVRLTQYSSA